MSDPGPSEVGRLAVVYVDRTEASCLGSFVGENTVITAAHCLIGAVDEAPVVRFRNSDQAVQSAKAVSSDYPAEPDFSSGRNDLVVLSLKPSEALVARERRAGHFDVASANEQKGAYVPSWGGDPPNSIETTRVPMFSSVDVANGSTCSALGILDQGDARGICVQPSAATNCVGDSGAPLLVRSKAGFAVAGVLSHSRSGAFTDSSRCTSEPAVVVSVFDTDLVGGRVSGTSLRDGGGLGSTLGTTAIVILAVAITFAIFGARYWTKARREH